MSERPVFRLRLLGSVTLSGPSGPVGGRASQRRPLALLSLLAASDDGLLSRDKLVAYLWPETESDRARHRLSVTLHAIRKTLGKKSVLSLGDDLQLNPEVVDVDVAAFEAALDEDEPARSVELYAGPFMDGFHLDGAPGFERWQQAERTRLSRRYAEALETLAERSEAEGDVRRALEAWRKLAEHDPFSSRVALRLMRALEWAGDRPGALRVARRHGVLVREELDVEPDPELLALAERLENGEVEREKDLERAARGPAPTSADTAPSAPAVGRRPTPLRSGGSRERALSGRLPLFRLPSGAAAAIAVLLVAVGTAVVLASGGADEPASGEPTYDSKRVLVDLFENRTGDRELEALGRMAADWITQGLTYTGFVDVVTRGKPILGGQAASDATETSEDGDRLARLARANGTGTLVWGSFYRAGDSVYFQAHVTDAGDRRELASLEPVAAAVEAPVPGLEQLRDRVMVALATLTDPRLAKWQRHASRPPSFEAYQRFVEGLELHTTHGRMVEAAERFRAAAALDPDFTMAKLWEAMALGNAGSWEEASAILEKLNQRRERLAPLDRAYLDYQRARSGSRAEEGKELRKLQAARRMVEIAPGSEYLKLAGSAALEVNRPAEAVRHYERADPESGWLRGWTPYWGRLARAHHRLENYERALEVARRGRALHPKDLRIREQEVRALGALGRIDELEKAIGDALELDAGRGAYLIQSAAEELMAHGHEAPSRRMYREAIEHRRQRLAEAAEGSDEARSHELALVRLLRAVEDLPAANARFEALLAEEPRNVWILREGALLRAREGRRAEAMELLRRMEDLDAPRYMFPEPEVAALLGERERAMDLLREYEERLGLHRPYLRHAPTLSSLWDHPAFQELMRPRG